MKTFPRLGIVPVVALLMVGASALSAQTSIQLNPTALTLSAQQGSSTPVSATFTISTTSTSALSFILTPSTFSGGSWLTPQPSPSGGTVVSGTPVAVTVYATPTGLAAGSYSGQIQIANSSSVSPVNLPITFTVGQLSVTPTSLAFSYQSGGPVPVAQSLTVGGSTGLGFQAASTTSTGGGWLQVAPTTGTVPSILSISLNSEVLSGLAAGTYNGTVTITPTSGNNTPATVPVVLTVTALPALTVSPTAIAFYYQIGGTNNQLQQSISLSSNGINFNYSLTFSNDPNPAGANWLTVGPTLSGVTPATLSVGLATGNLGNLPAGTYSGQIVLNTPGATPATTNIPVTLTVSSTPLLTLNPTALSFAYQISGATPAAQTIATGSTGTALAYTSTVATASGGSWLTATPSGTTPTAIAVNVSPGQLTPGTYTGTITVAAITAGNPSQQVSVTLTVSNDAIIVPSPASLTFNDQVGQAVPGGQLLAIGSSTGVALNYTATAATTAGGNWLAVAGALTTTGSTGSGPLAVTVNTSGLQPGTYHGTISIAATNSVTGVAAPNSPQTVNVTLYVSNNALLNVGQYYLSFTSVNYALPATQSLALTSTNPNDQLTYTATATTANGSPWLIVPGSGQTPSNLQVSVAPTLLSAGTYTGTITITAKDTATGADTDNSPQTLNVTLNVSSGTLAASPTSLTFTQAAGASAPANQAIAVTSSGTALNYTATASTTAGGSWLSVSPTSGATPGSLAVSVNGTNLSQGTYQGSILVQSPGNGTPISIPVTLTVTAPQTMTVAPASLTFNYQLGGPATPSQTVQVTSSGAALPFTAVAAVTGGASWLSVSPATGNTPGTLTVSVNMPNPQVGSYLGTVTVTSPGAGNSPQTINVTLNIQAAAGPGSIQVVNAASGVPGMVAPGEIVQIFGTNLGPATGVAATVTNNALPNTLSNVQVTFDGTPAPLLYVSATQVNAVVPYGVAGKASTNMNVTYNEASSGNIAYRVADTSPGIFTVTQTGTGQGAILNQDGTVNSASKPAAKSSVIVIYATGQGVNAPANIDGHVTPSDGTGLTQPVTQPVSVTVGGQPAKVLYAGSAPGLVAGAFQVNVQLPDGVASGNAAVVITVGTGTSQAGITVAVQ